MSSTQKIVLYNRAKICFHIRVSNGTTTAALADRPGPPLDPATGNAPVATRTARLLGVLHKLIDHGKGLAQSLQQRIATASTTAPSAVTRHFGTLNIVLILSRIVRGLRLAAALEARLIAHPLREHAAPAVVRPRSDLAPRARRPAEPSGGMTASALPDVPTAEEIAAALRHRPVGEVIADICRDLGIVPSHPLWDELATVITEFGGNYVRLFKDVLDRVCSWFEAPSAIHGHGWPAPSPQTGAACGAGPP
jgi:hypothetical protein